MSLQNVNAYDIDEFLNIVENALDKKAQANELIVTDAVGQSMRPTILSGDRIVIDSTKKEELKTGDIIAFQNYGLLVCHRIVNIREENGKKLFATKGDAYICPDSFEIQAEQIAGKVIRIIKRPFSFYFINYFKRAIKAVLEFFGVYGISKEIFYKIVKNNIRFYIAVPRSSVTHPSYKFINLPLNDVMNGDKRFFTPLKSMDVFKVVAMLGAKKVGTLEIYRVAGKSKKTCSWAVGHYFISSVFIKTTLEADLWETACRVLKKVDFTLEGQAKVLDSPMLL